MLAIDIVTFFFLCMLYLGTGEYWGQVVVDTSQGVVKSAVLCLVVRWTERVKSHFLLTASSIALLIIFACWDFIDTGYWCYSKLWRKFSLFVFTFCNFPINLWKTNALEWGCVVGTARLANKLLPYLASERFWNFRTVVGTLTAHTHFFFFFTT